jgi:tetratricopeptide (TPR) repeat protein
MHLARTSATALALLLTAGRAGAQAPLPRLTLELYPPAARDHIGRVYRNAQSHPDDAAAAGALARVFQAWEQWEAAHQAYARAQALAPKMFDWHYLDAVVLQRLARHGEAAAQLAQAVAVSPSYLPARVKLAESLLEAGDFERSRRLFEELAREPRAEPAAQLGLGRIAALRGDHASAIEHLQRATDLFPEFGTAYYVLARSYQALGRSEEAQRALDRHAQFGPRWPAIDDPVLAGVMTLREDAAALVRRGLKLADAGDLAGAIAAHEAALDRSPDMVQARANLISLYGRAGNFAKAEENYRAVIARGVGVDDAHYDYGVLLGMQEKWDEAAEAYRKALAANPLHARAHNNLGQVLERRQKYGEAEAEYRLAVEAQPMFRLARFNLGRMLLVLRRPEEAIGELQRLTEPRDAETPPYLFALSTAYVRSGHLSEGIRWATEAKELALAYGQDDLAATIERDLARIK